MDSMNMLAILCSSLLEDNKKIVDFLLCRTNIVIQMKIDWSSFVQYGGTSAQVSDVAHRS